MLEPLEARLMLAMMRDDVPSGAYEAYGQSPAYDPVVWVGRVDSTGAIREGGSGVVIDGHWLLISGHQVTDQTYTSLVFGTGTNLFTDPGETYAIADLITYPGYTGGWGGARDDIALAYSPSLIAITPAVRFTGTDEVGSHVSIVGYGTPGTTSGGLGAYDGEQRGGENIVDSIGDSVFGFGTNYFIADFGPLRLIPSPSMPLEFGGTPGDSGGGWFNDSGELVALSAFQYSDYKYSGGIRITQYNSWIDQMIASQDPLEVSISRDAAQAPLTKDAPVLFTAVFSDQVTDFDASDVVASGAPGTLSYVVTPVGADGTTYNIAVSGMTGDGQVVVSIPADAAHNAGGNGNSASTALDAGVTYDVTPPGGSIVDVLTNDATPLLGGTASDANGISGVSVTVGAQTFAGVLNTADGTWSAEVPASLLDGAHTATVTVTDNAGNVSTDTATVTVDTAAPVVGVTSLTTTITTPTLTGPVTDASPSSGITGVTVVVGGQTLAATVTGNTWSAVVETPLADGTYDVAATAADAAGNTAADGTANELVVNTHPWHNSADPCNVDGRSGVEPVDVLLVINYINAHGSGPLPAPGPNTPPPYVDVNADNEVTPVDVLLVINWINSQTIGGSGEAEPWSDFAAESLASPTLWLVSARALWPFSDRATSATAGFPPRGCDGLDGCCVMQSTAEQREPDQLEAWHRLDWVGDAIGLEGILEDLTADLA